MTADHRQRLMALRETLASAQAEAERITVEKRAEYAAMTAADADGEDGQRVSDAVDELDSAVSCIAEAWASLQSVGA